MSKKDDS
jgi:26S proteasome regulatory subunit T1